MSSLPAAPLAALTGAHGWLGRSVVRTFRARGWRTRGLVRRPAGAEEVAFALGEPIRPEALAGAETLIHAAWDFAPRAAAGLQRVNVEGTEQLFAAARQAGVPKLVYVSTMSAFPGARSLYGQTKLAAEAVAQRYGALIVRPGLIWGEEPGGMVGALRQQVRGGPVLPLLAGEARLYAVHEADLCALLFRFAAGEFPVPARPLTTAHPEPWTFRRLLQELARREGRAPFLLPLPWRAVWLALRAAEAAGLKLGFRSDSLLSLANQDPQPDFSLPPGLPFRPRPFLTPGS